MRKSRYILLIFCVFAFAKIDAQQTPAPTQSAPFTISGATAHIGNGSVIPNASVVIENGKITAIGPTTSTPSKGEVLDATGKHVYPGFIAANTTLGLIEVGAVRATNDDDEIGDFNPHIKALIAYNAESKVVESMRPNGVLTAQTRPQGGRISGTSSVVQLDAWNWEDAAYKANDGVYMNWPRSMTRGRWWLGEDPGYTANKKYQEDITELKGFVRNAKAYGKGNENRNLAFEAMEGIFDGTKRLYVSADDQRQILDALAFKKEMGIPNMIITGGYMAYTVAEELKAANVPVILQRVQELPAMDDHDYDLPYRMPKILTDAGVLVTLGYDGEYWQVRNLPFYAGQVTGQGMSDAQALQLITQNAAKILGIDDRTGTLEVGKDATLFISEGNALDMRGNKLSKAYIQGRDISLETHQTELWKRYSKKYEGD